MFCILERIATLLFDTRVQVEVCWHFPACTNVKILVVVKGSACVLHLSFALNSKPNSPTRRLTLHSDSRAMVDVQGKFLIPHQPSQARPIPTMS